MPTPPDERQPNEGLEPASKSSISIEADGNGTTDRPRTTTTKRIVNPRLEIGSESFAGNQIGPAQLHTHKDAHSEFRSASVTLHPPFEGRWDYHAGVRIYEADDLILTGICSEAKPGQGGKLHLKLWGPSWHLERTTLRSLGTFGMSNKENFYWLAKLTNPLMGPDVKGWNLTTHSGRSYLPFLLRT